MRGAKINRGQLWGGHGAGTPPIPGAPLPGAGSVPVPGPRPAGGAVAMATLSAPRSPRPGLAPRPAPAPRPGQWRGAAGPAAGDVTAAEKPPVAAGALAAQHGQAPPHPGALRRARH